MHSYINSPLLGLFFQLNTQQQLAVINIEKLPDHPLPAFIQLELDLSIQGYQQLQLMFDSAETEGALAQQLKRLHYSVVEPLRWQKQLTYQKSARLSLTEQCNFHCFFCHGEGVEMDVKRQAVDQDQLFAMIQQLAMQDYQDFTFTGGEPLLNWRLLEACLDYMQSIHYFPEITIVTNGERLNARMISRLQAYPGKLRFNFSLHSLMDADYLRIVHRQVKPEHGSDQLLSRTKAKIAMIAKANIPFKLNIVLLKGLNTQPEQLQAIIDYALEVGASAVKFLELLITEPLKQYYPYFYRLTAVKAMLDEQMTLRWQNQRKDVYQYRHTALDIELQHCPCARGCDTRLLSRGVTFSATGKFYSCFLRPEQSMQLDGDNLSQAVAFGDTVIENMAQLYGEHSPIVIKDVEHCKQEQAYYYQLNEFQKNKVQALLNGRLTRLREFEEQYLNHTELAHNEYRKLSRNSYESAALEVYQRIDYLPQTQQLRTQFLHLGLKVSQPQAHLDYLQAQGYTLGATLHWQVSFYQTPQQQYSLSFNPQSQSWFLRTELPFTELLLNLTPMQQMPFAWVLAHHIPCVKPELRPFSTDLQPVL